MSARLLAAALLLSGCAGEVIVVGAPESCSDDRRVGGVCVGATSELACREEPWTDGIACNERVDVASAAELGGAVAGAQPGRCLVLGQGSFPAVELPAGVSVLGRGFGCTVMSGVRSGGDATVRGLTVSGGVTAAGPGVHLDELRIEGELGDALVVEPDAEVLVTRSDIEGAAGYGVRAEQSGDVRLERVLLRDLGGPGLWAQCASGCACAAPAHIALDSVLVQRSHLAGMSLIGVRVDMHNVAVEATSIGSSFQYGGGIYLGACSELDASALVVADNADVGILLDDASAFLTGVSVRNNLRGIWAQNLGPARALTLEDSELRDNQGYGLRIGNDTVGGVVARGLSVAGTSLVSLPVLVDGVGASAIEVGHGIVWCGGSLAVLEGIVFDDNALVPLLIDESVAPGSSVSDVVLAGGDDERGLLQQRCPVGPGQPATGPGVLLEVTERELFADVCDSY